MGEMVEYGEELYLGVFCNFFLEVIDQGGKRAVADFAFLDLQRKNGIFVVEKGVTFYMRSERAGSIFGLLTHWMVQKSLLSVMVSLP